MTDMTMLAKAEAADHAAAEAMNKWVIVKSAIYTSGERDPRQGHERQEARGRLHLMGHDPRLSKMPERPTVLDFFKHQGAGYQRRMNAVLRSYMLDASRRKRA